MLPLAAQGLLRPAGDSARVRRDVLRLTVWFVLGRLVIIGAIAAAAWHSDRSAGDAFTVFDGGFYRSVAESGYPAELPGGPAGVGMSSVAFFPLFPLAVSGLMALGLPFAMGAVLLNTLAAAADTVLLYLVIEKYASREVAFGAALLWSAQPISFVLSLAYAEALYSALAFGCLLLLLRRHWVTAGAVAALASATRPGGLVLALCAAVAAGSGWRERAPDRWRALLAPLLAPLGFLAYLAYLAVHTGRLDAWLVTERQGWGSSTDGGVETARRVLHYLGAPTERPAGTAVALVLVLVAILVAVLLRRRPPAVVTAFVLLTVLLAVVTRNTYSSIPRFLLPATGLVIVPLLTTRGARQGARRDPAARRVAALALVGVLATAAAAVYVTTTSTFPP